MNESKRLDRELRAKARAEVRELRAEVLSLRDRVRELRGGHVAAVSRERAELGARRRALAEQIREIRARAAGDLVRYATGAAELRAGFREWWAAVLLERKRRIEAMRIGLLELRMARKTLPGRLRDAIRRAREASKAQRGSRLAELHTLRVEQRAASVAARKASVLRREASKRARTPAQMRATRHAGESWGERLDALAANLSPELLGVWPMARSAVLAKAKRSRNMSGDHLAELVAEWAAEHASEIVGREQDSADRDVLAIVAAREAAEAQAHLEASEAAAVRYKSEFDAAREAAEPEYRAAIAREREAPAETFASQAAAEQRARAEPEWSAEKRKRFEHADRTYGRMLGIMHAHLQRRKYKMAQIAWDTAAKWWMKREKIAGRRSDRLPAYLRDWAHVVDEYRMRGHPGGMELERRELHEAAPF